MAHGTTPSGVGPVRYVTHPPPDRLADLIQDAVHLPITTSSRAWLHQDCCAAFLPPSLLPEPTADMAGVRNMGHDCDSWTMDAHL